MKIQGLKLIQISKAWIAKTLLKKDYFETLLFWYQRPKRDKYLGLHKKRQNLNNVSKKQGVHSLLTISETKRRNGKKY